MDTILDMPKTIYPYSVLVYYEPMLHGKLFWFLSGNCIGVFLLGKQHGSPTIMGAISLCFGTMSNALLLASVHSTADKIEERITFALSHAGLYLSESDDERDGNYAAAKTFDISCGGGRSRYLL